MADVNTALPNDGAVKKGVWQQLRENPFLLGLSMVCALGETMEPQMLTSHIVRFSWRFPLRL